MENSNWKLLSAVPRFVVKNFDVAADFYRKLGFEVDYRDEGFMILSRDSAELHMNLDTEMVRGRTVCYIRLNGIDSLHKNTTANGVTCHPLVMKEYGAKEFWLNDPFMNIIIFAKLVPAPKITPQQLPKYGYIIGTDRYGKPPSLAKEMRVIATKRNVYFYMEKW